LDDKGGHGGSVGGVGISVHGGAVGGVGRSTVQFAMCGHSQRLNETLQCKPRGHSWRTANPRSHL
jgi:hypothetical protein